MSCLLHGDRASCDQILGSADRLFDSRHGMRQLLPSPGDSRRSWHYALGELKMNGEQIVEQRGELAPVGRVLAIWRITATCVLALNTYKTLIVIHDLHS